jgi:HEAT repeat protein
MAVNNDLLGKIEQMAVDDDWRVRESAAENIRQLNERYFEDYYPVWKEWVHDENHFLRRAAAMGLTRISPDHYSEAWNLIEPLLYDENIYVRKSMGRIVLGAVSSRMPVESFRRMRELVQNQQNHNLRWNIATSLGSRYGLQHPKESLALLHELARDERRFVWRAASASLIKQLERHPQLRREVLGWDDEKAANAVVKKYVAWGPDEDQADPTDSNATP